MNDIPKQSGMQAAEVLFRAKLEGREVRVSDSGTVRALGDVEQLFVRVKKKILELIDLPEPSVDWQKMAREAVCNKLSSQIQLFGGRELSVQESSKLEEFVDQLTSSFDGDQQRGQRIEAALIKITTGRQTNWELDDHLPKILKFDCPGNEGLFRDLMKEIKKVGSKNLNTALKNSVTRFLQKEKGLQGERLKNAAADVSYAMSHYPLKVNDALHVAQVAGRMRNASKDSASRSTLFERAYQQLHKGFNPQAAPDAASQPHSASAVKGAKTEAGRFFEAINRALPAAMPHLSSAKPYGSCILELAQEAEENLYLLQRENSVMRTKPANVSFETRVTDLMREMETDEEVQSAPQEAKVRHDLETAFDGLALAFYKDTNRARFVFIDENARSVECDHERDKVLEVFNTVVGANKNIRETLSKLVNQEIVKCVLREFQQTFVNRAGREMTLAPGIAAGAMMTTYTLERKANGDFVFGFEYLARGDFLELDDGHVVETNQDKRFKEPLSRDNAGLCITHRVLIDAREARLKTFKVIPLEPATMKIQLEVREPKK